jgi:hypothetical protein
VRDDALCQLRTEETAAAGDEDLHRRNGERNCL